MRGKTKNYQKTPLGVGTSSEKRGYEGVDKTIPYLLQSNHTVVLKSVY
jgi:hypothetical protein